MDLERWHHSAESLREAALRANHARSRERFLALYEITEGKNATQVGRQTGQNPQTIMDWVHRYNQTGLESLEYRHTGGPPPLHTEVQHQLDAVVRQSLTLAATPPQERKSLPLPRWTLKRLVIWVKKQFGIDCCRDTVRKVLQRLGFSWKKAHKLLNKGNPLKRAAFLERLQDLLKDALHQQCLLVYIDELTFILTPMRGTVGTFEANDFGLVPVHPEVPKSPSMESILTISDKSECLLMTRQTIQYH